MRDGKVRKVMEEEEGEIRDGKVEGLGKGWGDGVGKVRKGKQAK